MPRRSSEDLLGHIGSTADCAAAGWPAGKPASVFRHQRLKGFLRARLQLLDAVLFRAPAHAPGVIRVIEEGPGFALLISSVAYAQLTSALT